MNAATILAVMGVYFFMLLAISWIVGKKAGPGAFYNGDHKSPWYVVAFGMIGATLSGVTFISVPGEVGNTAFHYLQFVLGNFVGYLIIANYLLPYYYRKNAVSIYSVLNDKMGPLGHQTTSAFFVISKLIGAGFRLYLVVVVLQMAVFETVGWPFALTTMLCLVVIWLYTFRSGIKAIVWSDTLQTLMLIVTVIVTLVVLVKELITNVLDASNLLFASPVTKVFEWNWRSPDFFFKQFISGILITLAINGFDQDIIQKNLTCKNENQARRNMVWFSFGFVLVVALFLVMGALLHCFAEVKMIEVPAKSDQLFPLIALNHLGPLAALLFVLGVTAAAFSSADSATTAITTTFCFDFIQFGRFSSKEQVRIRFLVHFIFSILLFGIIMFFHSFNDQSVVVSIFKAAGYTYGPILGMFVFLFLIKRSPSNWSIVPSCVTAPLLTYLITHVAAQSGVYQFGFEIILVNALLTLAMLLIFSKNSKNVKNV